MYKEYEVNNKSSTGPIITARKEGFIGFYII